MSQICTSASNVSCAHQTWLRVCRALAPAISGARLHRGTLPPLGPCLVLACFPAPGGSCPPPTRKIGEDQSSSWNQVTGSVTVAVTDRQKSRVQQHGLYLKWIFSCPNLSSCDAPTFSGGFFLFSVLYLSPMNKRCVLGFAEMTDNGRQGSKCVRARSPDKNVTTSLREVKAKNAALRPKLPHSNQRR